MTTIKTIEQTIYVRVSDSEDTLTLTQTTGGLELAANIVAGLNAADGPSAANAFATKTDIAAALSEVDANLNTHDGDVGAHAAAVGLHSASSDPHGDRAYAVSQIAAHQSADDPHSDRLYASAAVTGHNGDPSAHEAINSRFDLSGAATSAVAAHAAAADPHGDRAYARSIGYPLPVPVMGDWSDAATAYADIASHLKNLTIAEGRTFAIVLLGDNTLVDGANDVAVLLLKRNTGILYASYYQAFSVPPSWPTSPDVAVVAMLPFEPASANDLLEHDEGRPAHFLTSEIVEALNGSESPYDFPSPTNWVVTEAEMQEHRTANDPHGDRAFTASALNEHESLTFDPHGDRAYTTSSIATHASAPDQHGDRAYADAQMAAHVAADDPHGDRLFASTAMDQHTNSAGAHLASNIEYETNGNLGARDVNGAIDELDANVMDHAASATAHPEIKSGIARPFVAPASQPFAWNNQGTSVLHEYLDHLAIVPQITGGTSTYSMRCLERALDGGGDFSIIGAVSSIASAVGTHSVGIYVGNGSIVYNAMLGGYTAYRCEQRPSVSYAGLPTAIAQVTINAPVLPTWFKIARASDTITFSVSLDGQTWMPFGSVAVGPATFTFCGFFAEQRSSAGTAWSVGQLESFNVA